MSQGYQQKDNSGSLFRNDRKESDKHPDYKGNAKIDGVDYWISAWLKEKNGQKYFSFSFQPKQQQQGNSRPAAKSSHNDEDIPF